MKNTLHLLVSLYILLLLNVPGLVQAQSYSYFPSASERDARFLIIAGSGLSSYENMVIEMLFEINATTPTLDFGIFDGETSGYWDYPSTTFGPQNIYTLYADPDRNSATMVLLNSWQGNTMPDNAWWGHVMGHTPLARLENGDFRYRLVVVNVNPKYSGLTASFKVRANGTIKMLSDYPFAFSAIIKTMQDVYIVFPEYVNAVNPGPSTYDGEWTFYIYLPQPARYLEFWEADLDLRGLPNGVNTETDDPNTPNDYIPPWAVGTNPLTEGVRPGNPADDAASLLYRRSPAIRYEVIDPRGTVYRNDNPSGNQEWELFRIDTAPFDPAIMDYHADELPAGIYTIHISGLDIHNFGTWKFFNDLIGSDQKGRVIVPPEAICSLGDYVWNDVNRDGIQDSNEAPIAGVRILLYNQLGEIIDSATSGADGHYLFKNVPPIQVTVRVDSTTLPSGFIITSGSSFREMFLEPSNHPRDVDFGYAAGLEPSCGKPVFAWYEAWYGSLKSDSTLRYWDFDNRGGIVDTARFDAYGAYYGVESAVRPDLYDANDPDIWEYHILQAWAAEIDAFVVDWFGRESYEQSPTRGLLAAAERLYQRYGARGFDFRIIVAINEKAMGGLAENLAFLADSVLTHPAYYHGREGLPWRNWQHAPRPLFVFSPAKMLDPVLFHQLRTRLLPQDVEIVWNWDGQDAALDGLVQSVYPWVDADAWDARHGMEWGHSFLEDFYRSAQQLDIDFVTGAVWPGYDDRNWRQGESKWMDRQETRVYRGTWEQAFAHAPRWLLVESWNDFNRSTHIHISKMYGDTFIELTRREAIRWKGGSPCARNLAAEALPIPENYLNGEKRPLRPSILEEALALFFQRNYAESAELLALGQGVAANADAPSRTNNALTFVKGSPTYHGEGWANAVDGDLEGWDGTVTARGAGDPNDIVWAIFRFSDPGLFAFDYINVQTDNGLDDDGLEERQATRIELQVCQSEDLEGGFESVAHFRLEAGGQMEWYGLGRLVTARYIKLIIHEPRYTSGGWRQIVEFGVNCADRKGARPMQQQSVLAALPLRFGLDQNYPNPFNPVTTIPYQLSEAGAVTLILYDLQGREVATLVDGEMPAGHHTVQWSAAQVANGTYFCRLTSGARQAVRRLIVMK